jgi:regulator of protease activity HflC (stomatin/prohibitin superfamily)
MRAKRKRKDMDSFIKLVLALVVGGVILGASACSVFTIGADEIAVKQDAVDGILTVYTTAGTKWQGFGRVTKYKKSAQYWFSVKDDEGKKTDDSILVRFNDGGHGSISGSLRYDLPLDSAMMIKLHSKYGSMEAINHELIAQVVNKSVYMVGPLMSSRESYAEKKADLINYITDQIMNGVYRTERTPTKVQDPVSGTEKTVDIVKPMPGAGPGGFIREEVSPLSTMGIVASNITINNIIYDQAIEEQIKAQQVATNSVQQAMVDARKAEQRAITVKAEGEADAAKAKWTQEVEKAKAVTEAEQQRDVAKLALDTANLDKQATIARAEGEAKAKTLSQAANNNLELKLNAWVDVNKAYADAMSKQPWVPSVQMGAAGAGNSAGSELVALLTAQTAKQLALSVAPGR